MGVINVRGRIIPVINIRKRFHLPEREIQLTDRIIIARTSKYQIAFTADEVTGLIENIEDKSISLGDILPGLDNYFEGVAKFGDDIILIYNPESLVSLEEEKKLKSLMENK